VLSRKIEPGQTVAASLSSPVLFNLAEDLARMELQVNVDEADVGQVRDGQSATFTVDAYPARRYPALITRVGLGSTTTDNVVSYKTILEVANDDLSLRPGMTATAEIVTAKRENALLVPNAALRFEPSAGADAAAPTQDGGIVSKLLPRMPAPARTRKNSAAGADGNTQRVWVLRNGEPAAVVLSVGVSDGQYTEVTGGLDAGADVIVDSLPVSR
jgi:HlyD family secretion protein